MNISVQAKAIEVIAKTITPFVVIKLNYLPMDIVNYATISLPLFNKVLSIAGHSISAINPKFLRGETVAVYA